MEKNLKKGFTLIELLVVIAIIGILSGIVLASLNTARTKGADAAIKGNLSGMRPQAELVYDNTNSYEGVCEDDNILAALNGSRTQAGVTAAVAVDAAGSATTVTCNDSITGWAAQVPLRSQSGSFACVDNNGSSTTTTASAIASSTDNLCI